MSDELSGDEVMVMVMVMVVVMVIVIMQVHLKPTFQRLAKWIVSCTTHHSNAFRCLVVKVVFVTAVVVVLLGEYNGGRSCLAMVVTVTEGTSFEWQHDKQINRTSLSARRHSPYKRI
jgi:hypothetical protein